MFKPGSIFAAMLLSVMLSNARADDYSVEAIDAAPEAEDVPGELVELFSDKGVRVKRNSTRTVCEIWFCKELEIDPEFEGSLDRLYPFTPGQLIGLLHFSRRGSEFRDQTIDSGWYTLRFDLQPVDGNHVGTSPTRDFLVLVNAEQDEADKLWGVDELHEASAEAAGSSHPAMMCLQKTDDVTESAIRQDEANDWTVLEVVTKGVANGKPQEVPVGLVVVGHASE